LDFSKGLRNSLNSPKNRKCSVQKRRPDDFEIRPSFLVGWIGCDRGLTVLVIIFMALLAIFYWYGDFVQKQRSSSVGDKEKLDIF
jgi:hypothetical protein